MRGLRTFALLSLLSCALAACGGRQRPGARGTRPIDKLRAQAEAHPEDPALALALARAEHFYDGGDPERARKALERALQLAGAQAPAQAGAREAAGAQAPPGASERTADDLELTFVQAEQHVLEGEPDLALSAYLALLERAAGSVDARGAAAGERRGAEARAPLFAELALLSLLDMNDATDDYRPRVRETFAKLHPRADTLGLQAAHQLRLALATQASQDGDSERAQALAREAGCIAKAEVAGPFGPRELLAFDQVLPAEKPGPLAKEYDLGPGRGVRPVRTVETRRCAFGLGRGAHDALPGTSIVRAEIEVEAGSYALRVESPNSFVLWVDGQERARIDLRVRPGSGVRYLPLTLTPGKHELKLKVSSRHPNPVLSLALRRADANAIEATRLPAPGAEPDGAIDRFLIAKVALGRGDLVGARELVRKLGHAEPTANWLVLEAATALADPLKTAELRRDRARELLTRAEKQNPRAWYPSVGLSRLASAEGRAKEAIEALRQAQSKWPAATAIRTNLIEQLRESGYVEEAEHLLEALQREMPHACAVVNLGLSMARQRGRMAEAARLTEQVMGCDASSSARANLLKMQQKYEEAARELTRLESLSDPLDRAQALEAELERARLTADQAKVNRLRAERVELWPDRPEPVLERVDALLASGERTAALGLLDRSLAAHPGQLYELRRVEDALAPDQLFKGLRKRSDEAIRAFEATRESYAEPQVLVLDYTVVRLFEDGSNVSLTHNIIRVQSQEAVDDNGEFSVPDGARLLSLHTRKADGTLLEPDLIAGKSSWSLPNLAPGDYVEFEFVRGESPSLGFPGGYLGDRFYFKSFEVPFHHSELVVVLPAAMEPVLDPRGPLPTVTKDTRGGLTTLRWTAEQSRALTPEPSSVASREFLPSINLGVKVSWQAYIESLRDLLSDKDVYDPAAREFVTELLGPLLNAPASARAERLYRWVTDQIEATDEVFGSSAAMLSARTGSRERILRYMLTLAGVESELLLARGAEADHSDAALPDPETFGYLLLRVQTEKGPILLHAGARHAPFGFLPPQLRGEKALLVNARADLAETPKIDLDRELRTVEVAVELSSEGKGQLHVREIHRGASAVEWRNDLDSIPAAELESRFEQSYAAKVIPGARLTRLALEAREDPEAPFVLDYQLEVDDLGQRSGNQLRIAGLFPNLLAAHYARQGSRSTTELVAPPQATDIRVTYSLPKGARVVALPKGGVLNHSTTASFTSRAEPRERQIELTRSLRVPIARVTPADYPAFATFCRSADALEGSELVIDLGS